MENNIKLYVSNFNLIKTGNDYSDVSGKCVFRIKDEYVELKTSRNRWKRYKHGDLVVSVINNIPLHG
jgi:hypothetical protein